VSKRKDDDQPMIDFGEAEATPNIAVSTPITSQPLKIPDSVKAACATLPVLYSKRSDGKIQEWWIEVDGDKYRMVSGIINGEHVTSNWTVAQPKNAGRANATTAVEQAISEAKSAWQKKRDLKYFETAKEAEESEQFKCMLAQKFNDYEDEVTYPVWTQPKLDGMRCDTTVGAMVSRNGKLIVSAPHILKALEPIFAEDPSLRFDGELYCNKLANDFNAIISHVRKTKPTAEDLKASAEAIQYWIYDLPSHGGKFSERSAALETLLKKHPHPSLVFVPTYLAANRQILDSFYEKWLEEGYEGQMVRIDSAYENKRAKCLLKRKEFEDGEFEILGVYEGIGNRAGTAGYMAFKTKDGKPFKSNIKGGMEWYKKLWLEKDELVGKQATLRFFKPTPDGIPRFPFVHSIRDFE